MKCAYCQTGEVVPPRRRFCSTLCNNRHQSDLHNAQTSEQRTAARRARPCRVCGKAFTPPPLGRTPLRCGSCRAKDQR
jgi:hypothetical protein